MDLIQNGASSLPGTSSENLKVITRKDTQKRLRIRIKAKPLYSYRERAKQ